MFESIFHHIIGNFLVLLLNNNMMENRKLTNRMICILSLKFGYYFVYVACDTIVCINIQKGNPPPPKKKSKARGSCSVEELSPSKDYYGQLAFTTH